MQEDIVMSKQLWEMTLKQYKDYQINSCDKETIQNIRELQKEDNNYYNDAWYYQEWLEVLENAALDGNIIPEHVLRSLVNHLGKEEGEHIIHQVFRGRTSIGAEAWYKAQTNKQPKWAKRRGRPCKSKYKVNTALEHALNNANRKKA
jgi:hypothetical protein